MSTSAVIALTGAAALAACQPGDPRPAVTPRPAASVGTAGLSSPVPVERTRWSVDLGDSTDIPLAFTDDLVFLSTHHGTVAALDARSGSVRWRADLGAISDTAVAADGRLHVAGTDVNTSQCHLRTFDAASGASGWSWSTRACPGVSATVGSGVVYLGIGAVAKVTGRQTERDLARVVALDAGTGRLRWSRRIDSAATVSRPVVAGRMVYVSKEVGELVALDAASGRVRWQVGRWGGRFSPPVVHSGLLYVVRTWGYSESAVYAFDAQTGRRRWVSQARGLVAFKAPVGTDTVVLFSQDGRVRGLNHRTGQVRWVREFGTTDSAHPLAPPVAWRNLVYVRLAGALHAMDASTGHTRWTDQNPPPGDPLGAYNGVVYLSADNGVLSAIGPA